MNCLEKYRSGLLADINRNLRIIVVEPEREAIHRFRVGVKRLTALYRLLGSTRPDLKAKRLLRPARELSRSISKIRDIHISLDLVTELEAVDTSVVKTIQRSLNLKIRRDYRSFRKLVDSQATISLRLPTLRSMELTEAGILRQKPLVLDRLLTQILNTDKRLNAIQWHDKRILLKRYHHSLDAFQFCPGHTLDEAELKQMKMLEQLLGDWHDRVIAVELLDAMPTLETVSASVIKRLQAEEKILLGSARIYLARYAAWHRQS